MSTVVASTSPEPSTVNFAASSPADDRLDGVPAIAAFMGTTERVARYKLAKGIWPHAREGNRFIASKRALMAYWLNATGAPIQQSEA